MTLIAEDPKPFYRTPGFIEPDQGHRQTAHFSSRLQSEAKGGYDKRPSEQTRRMQKGNRVGDYVPDEVCSSYVVVVRFRHRVPDPTNLQGIIQSFSRIW